MFKILDSHQVARLLQVAPEYGPPTNAAVALLVHCGLRVGELVQLTWQDLFDGPKPMAYFVVRAGTTKTGYGRTLSAPEPLQLALRQHRAALIERRTFLDNRAAPLLPGDTLHHWSVRWVQMRLDTISRRHLGRPLSPHVLRHTFATRLLKTADIRTVQAALGHRWLNSTQVYTHTNLEDLAAAMSRLADAASTPAEPQLALDLERETTGRE